MRADAELGWLGELLNGEMVVGQIDMTERPRVRLRPGAYQLFVSPGMLIAVETRPSGIHIELVSLEERHG